MGADYVSSKKRALHESLVDMTMDLCISYEYRNIA